MALKAFQKIIFHNFTLALRKCENVFKSTPRNAWILWIMGLYDVYKGYIGGNCENMWYKALLL